MRIIGQIDIQAYEVRKILTKYWSVLLLDNEIRDFLPSRPMITYRKGRSLRDRLFKSHFDPPKPIGTWLDRKPRGCFPCGTCKFCNMCQREKLSRVRLEASSIQLKISLHIKQRGSYTWQNVHAPKTMLARPSGNFNVESETILAIFGEGKALPWQYT